MKYLKYFKESNVQDGDFSIYNIDWHYVVPENLTMIYADQAYHFVCRREDDQNFPTNIMKHSDLIQITYNLTENTWGKSDCLEFDLHFLKIEDGKLKIDVDITWGNFMESEFSITAPNNVSVIQCTSRDSKFDPSNTVFAFDDSSLQSIVDMFNKLDHIHISTDDLSFLHLGGRCPQ
jgi:tellurite resistance-related uncharacterized protein